MIWGLLVPQWLRRFMAWAVAGLAAVVAIFLAGRREARRKADLKALKGYKATRERMDDVPSNDGLGVDDIQRILRTRDPHKR